MNNLTQRRMFTGKVWTDGSRLLQESNLAVRQPRRAPHHVMQSISSEGLAQGPYVAAGGERIDAYASLFPLSN